MQRIEADAVGAEAMGQFDQALEVGEIANPPIAPRTDAVKLDREQPAAVEIAGEGARRGHDQRHVFRRRNSIGDFQAVDAQRQTLGQHDDPARGDVFGDNLLARRDFPCGRQLGARQQRGPRRLPRADHDRLADQRPRRLRRQRFEDDFQGCFVRHTAVTLAVQKFGLNSPGVSYFKKVHSARGLHANT